MTRLVVSVDDKFGNPLAYQLRAVQLELEGEAQLIGENPLLLISGSSACLVKSGHKAGLVRVKAQTAGLEEATITIQIGN
jgi:beta-galactosidase